MGLDSLQTDKKEIPKRMIIRFHGFVHTVKEKYFIRIFGHNKATWWTPFILQHFLDGIKWSLSELEGPSKSIPHKK